MITTHLRKVPYPLPESYEKYLGIPYSKYHVQRDAASNFVEHFEKPLLKHLEKFGIELEVYSGAKCTKKGFTMNISE